MKKKKTKAKKAFHSYMKGTLRCRKDSFIGSVICAVCACILWIIALLDEFSAAIVFIGSFFIAALIVTVLHAIKVYGSSIVFSEKDRCFIAEKFFRQKKYGITEITSIQLKETRTTRPPSSRGNKPAHDGEIRTLILHCGEEKIRVSGALDSSGVFEQFLRKMTAPEIWMETKRIRVWNPLDIFLSSEEDPWEQERRKKL
ncbi:MAG: hypothetical protein IJ512_04720 [Ruminococcus sp.]|nr:hypothetical protein [Ruminococcus sp.]